MWFGLHVIWSPSLSVVREALQSKFLSSESNGHTQTVPNNPAAANPLLPHHRFILQLCLHSNLSCEYHGVGKHVCYRTATSLLVKPALTQPKVFPQADLFIFPGRQWAMGGSLWVRLSNLTEPALLPCGWGGGAWAARARWAASKKAEQQVFHRWACVSICVCLHVWVLHACDIRCGFKCFRSGNLTSLYTSAYIEDTHNQTYGMYLSSISPSCLLFRKYLCVWKGFLFDRYLVNHFDCCCMAEQWWRSDSWMLMCDVLAFNSSSPCRVCVIEQLVVIKFAAFSLCEVKESCWLS